MAAGINTYPEMIHYELIPWEFPQHRFILFLGSLISLICIAIAFPVLQFLDSGRVDGTITIPGWINIILGIGWLVGIILFVVAVVFSIVQSSYLWNWWRRKYRVTWPQGPKGNLEYFAWALYYPVPVFDPEGDNLVLFSSWKDWNQAGRFLYSFGKKDFGKYRMALPFIVNAKAMDLYDVHRMASSNSKDSEFGRWLALATEWHNQNITFVLNRLVTDSDLQVRKSAQSMLNSLDFGKERQWEKAYSRYKFSIAKLYDDQTVAA